MIIIESVILCLIFSIFVFIISKNPIKTLYNYPPKIQERVKLMEEYKDKIPTQKNKIAAKSIASLLIIIVLSLILKYINGYNSFIEGFKYCFLLWTIVNLYDAIVMDIIWFCHDKRFVFKGTEDMVDEYHNYWFHIKGFFFFFFIALFISFIVGIVLKFL